MIGQKNLSTATCPMTLAKLNAAPCIGTLCMGWRDLDGKSGYCGLAGQPTIATSIPGMTGAADSTK